jgi:hypothetical protein
MEFTRRNAPTPGRVIRAEEMQEERPMQKAQKTIREPNFVRSHDDGATSMRAGYVLLALILLGGLMYFSKDRVPTVADRPNPSPLTTTGSAPAR